MLDTLPMLVPIEAVDAKDVDHLLDVAFGPERHGRTAYRLREGMVADRDLSFAALDSDGRLIGSIQSWPVQLTMARGGSVPLVLVGPVAVDPVHQRRGLGREMMTRMLAKADDIDAAPQVLIGDPEYYGRFFGFDAGATGGWDLPGPFDRHRLLARTGGRELPASGMLGPRR